MRVDIMHVHSQVDHTVISDVQLSKSFYTSFVYASPQSTK